MKNRPRFHNCAVAALFALAFVAGPAALPAFAVDQTKLDDLFSRLKEAKDPGQAGRIEAEIQIEWARSGSATVDLLMQRGEDAMAAGNFLAAVEHYTAVIDHAPDFLLAWDARATALYSLGEIGPALSDMGHVLAQDPRHYDVLAGLGQILEETGDTKKALQAYLAAQAIHPYILPVNDAITRLQTELEGREL